MSKHTEIIRAIKQILRERQIRIMEVCGTHTVAVSRAGLRPLLAPEIKLLSGPGCPVCVTSAQDVAKFLWLAETGKTIVTFGDMMKVPLSNKSLFTLRADGADVHIIYSPLDALEIAKQNQHRDVVFIGVGFETTAPAIAGTIIEAQNRNCRNFTVITALKTIPIPLRIVSSSPQIAVDGFILPGHVSAIIGSDSYLFIPADYNLPGVVAGFEPDDIIDAVFRLSKMIASKKPAIELSYSRVVKPEGNISAKALIDKVFEPNDAIWRGLGNIPDSGLCMREEFAEFDAQKRFDIPEFPQVQDNPACHCADVILGIMNPMECPIFAKICTPSNPQGPCMISSEGACAAYYKYGQ